MSASSPEIRQAIREHALRESPREACGLIVRRGKKSVVVPCDNVAADPREFFVIHPDAWEAAEADAGEVEMVYHSHPFTGADPSEADKASAEKVGVPYLIYAPGQSADRDGWTLYRPCGYEAPYEGRPFVWNILDCYALLSDWYRRELGVVLPVIYREDYFWQSADLFTENLEARGFEEVPRAEVRRGDVLLFALNSRNNNPLGRPNHCAVYLGDGLMLHHPGGHNSRVEPYTGTGGFWLDHAHYRHAWRLP